MTSPELFLARATHLLTPLRARLLVAASPIDVAWELCEFTGRELDLVDCLIYLVDPDCQDGTLLQYAAWGPKRVAERVVEARIRLRLGQGVVGNCALTHAPQLIADTRLDPRYLIDHDHYHSELAVPIVHGDRLLGVIDTEHPDTDAYRAAHVRALLAIAGCAAERLSALDR